MTPQDAAVELAVEQIVVGEESMLDQVWRCTTDQEKNRGIIGLEPNLDKIQDAIGKRIALSAESWKDKSLQDKALDISNILSRKNFMCYWMIYGSKLI
ncbi:hypothetical protein WN943_022452 [Citrus x changshan-huyou]